MNPAYETVYDSENKEILYYNDGKNENLDPEVVALSRAAWENIKEEMSEVLITIDQDVTRDPMNENTTTSMAGNWQTGLMLEATKNLGTIAAFTNTGGIRVPYELEEGAEVKEITVADIYNMMNFDNQIVSFAITGQQMAQHLEMAMRGVDHLDANFGDQFSGIVVEYYDVMENGEKTGIKVTKITTDEGEEIDITDNEKTYNVCINSYCIGVSGSIFEGMTPLQDLYEAPVDNVSAIEILKAYAEENGPAYELDTTVRAVKVEAPATEAPAEPEKPEAPAETTPAEPAEPETPAEPEKPAEPETPAQPETPAPQPEPAPAEPAEGTTYVVAAGDCLWKIAAKLYGSGERWGEIYEANKAAIKDPQMIYIGQELLIP